MYTILAKTVSFKRSTVWKCRENIPANQLGDKGTKNRTLRAKQWSKCLFMLKNHDHLNVNILAEIKLVKLSLHYRYWLRNGKQDFFYQNLKVITHQRLFTTSVSNTVYPITFMKTKCMRVLFFFFFNYFFSFYDSSLFLWLIVK